MKLGIQTKQPKEVLDFDVEYADWIPSGDTLSSAVITVDDAGLTIDSHSISGTIVKVWLSGGVHGVKYKVTVLTTTTDGRIEESEFFLKVKEI